MVDALPCITCQTQVLVLVLCCVMHDVWSLIMLQVVPTVDRPGQEHGYQLFLMH